jgi:hypothetical protein
LTNKKPELAFPKWAPIAALVVLSFAFRLPPLVNAAATNSDAAIVGLQAIHIQHGELSFFLFGSHYQTSVDSFVAALFFFVLGATPRALMLSALCGHIAVTLFSHAILARHLSQLRAFALALLLVFTPAAIHSYALYPPREASIAIAFAALFCLDRASGEKTWKLALGCALASLACFADPYAFVFMPAVAVMALFAALDRDEDSIRKRVGAAFVGGVVGAIPLAILFSQSPSKQGELGIGLDRIVHNTHILTESCLPWLLSTTPFAAVHMMDYAPWIAPAWFRPVQWLGAVSFCVALAAAIYFSAARSTEKPLRSLGLAGAATTIVTTLGFFTSVMVMDHFSMRYLASILLVAPLSLAPLAARINARSLSFGLAPYLISAAVGGWASYGPDVSGIAIVREPSASTDDLRLGAELRARDVHVAVADYWVAYRLTFLFREDPIVVPSHESQDRYAPYRVALESAPRYALIVDPLRSEESLGQLTTRLASENKAFQRLDVGRMTALIVAK